MSQQVNRRRSSGLEHSDWVGIGSFEQQPLLHMQPGSVAHITSQQLQVQLFTSGKLSTSSKCTMRSDGEKIFVWGLQTSFWTNACPPHRRGPEWSGCLETKLTVFLPNRLSWFGNKLKFLSLFSPFGENTHSHLKSSGSGLKGDYQQGGGRGRESKARPFHL